MKILIKYQLHNQNEGAYDDLHKAIQEKFVRTKATNSMYFIDTARTPAQVFDFVRKHMYKTDFLRCDLLTNSYKGIIASGAMTRLKSH